MRDLDSRYKNDILYTDRRRAAAPKTVRVQGATARGGDASALRASAPERDEIFMPKTAPAVSSTSPAGKVIRQKGENPVLARVGDIRFFSKSMHGIRDLFS
ncbi:MAG: hypothetical protein HXY21_12890 [Parvularculaceae bacterium]|nr:hypothetical protein [Parvularculaceae bacterium]